MIVSILIHDSISPVRPDTPSCSTGTPLSATISLIFALANPSTVLFTAGEVFVQISSGPFHLVLFR